MFPEVSYIARIEMSDTEIVSIMSIHYSDMPTWCISWSAVTHTVRRNGDGTIEYLDAVNEQSKTTYASHLEAIEAGVNHFTRVASEAR